MADVIILTTYEAHGPGLQVALSHYAARDAAKAAAFKIIHSFGATAFRPGHDGRPRTVVFDQAEAPAGFLLERASGGRAECKPHRGTKIGRAFLEAIKSDDLARPDYAELAAAFAWSPPTVPTDGRSMWFATSARVHRPAVRIFLRLPRFAGDAWPGHPHLKEIRESDFLAAIEDHNRLAAAAREAA